MRNSLLAILFVLIVLTTCVACDTQDEPTLEDNIREYIGAPAATLTLVTTEDTAWLDYTYSQYLMVDDGCTYLVGVQHDGNSVHYVDTEASL